VQVRTADGGFTRSIAVPTPTKFPFMAESWDCAFKDAASNDFVCGQTWGKLHADCYLLDQVYQHLDLPGTLDAVRELSRRWPTASAKWVEDKANGPAVIQTLRREIAGLIAVEPQGKKTARAHAVAPIIEAGNVFLPHPDTVPTIDGHNWVLDLIDSCATLPTGAHDDDADALTQALNRLQLIPGVEPGYMIVQAHP
jgi:predicted phage terminase large subunit-like protein